MVVSGAILLLNFESLHEEEYCSRIHPPKEKRKIKTTQKKRKVKRVVVTLSSELGCLRARCLVGSPSPDMGVVHFITTNI